MEEDVGQALRQDSARGHNLDTQHNLTQQGSLMAQFSAIKDAVSDVTSGLNEQALSDNVEQFLQKFERAEYSLGHTLDDPEALDKAFLSNSENVISIFDHHNFQYSVKETTHEQDSATESGNELDENQITDLGRLKKGIQDTAHEDRNRKRTEDAARFVLQLSVHEQYLADLEEQIAQLREEIAELNEEIMALNEAQALLEEGDLNEDTQAGAAKRRKVDNLLNKSGMSIEDFKTSDDKYNEEAIRQAIEEETQKKQAELEAKETQLEDLEREYQEALKNSPADKPENSSEAKLAMANEASSLSNIVNEELNTTSLASNDDDWGTEWDSNWDNEDNSEYATAKVSVAETADSVVSLQTEEASRLHGSVAADESERNVISSAFAMAASGETPATPEVNQEQTYTQDRNHTQTYGMG